MTDLRGDDAAARLRRYNRFLLLVAGLGGLLYGVDVGIIASALPYLQATSGLNGDQLSVVVAAVLLGATISTLFAGWLADWMGRRWLMIVTGAIFVVSIPMISLAHGYGPLVIGRLCQGVSAGLIGVVVPLYLAESLPAATRGKGTAIFQWLLTLGIVAAALVGMYFSYRVDAVAKLGDAQRLFAFKDFAWRSIFWVSLPPGLFFFVGGFFLAESPRWLARRRGVEAAAAALRRSRTEQEVRLEMDEIQAALQAERAQRGQAKESLLKRKYVLPFLLACVILCLNQTTGINSLIGYNTNILLQSGLSDLQAHWGYIVFTLMNFLLTIVGVMLVDRRGRKFLLSLGTAGVVVSLVATGVLFARNERGNVDVRAAVQALVRPDQTLTLDFNRALEARLLAAAGRPAAAFGGRPASLSVIYAYGDFQFASPVVRSDQTAAKPIAIDRQDSLPANGVVAFFTDPFAALGPARSAPLVIRHATLTPLPSTENGWVTAVTLFFFMGFYAIGPGIVVWLALSELMPTRIRSTGMSIALLLNEAVSTLIAAIFLPTVGHYGYASMFFAFAAFTVLYFLVALLLLPETKGRTLEEIERFFAPPDRAADAIPQP
ncbi:MAG TPA: MFS transporter [Terriglobales bacterium]|nr:MFS transporter [Terriglobales bacterium]